MIGRQHFHIAYRGNESNNENPQRTKNTDQHELQSYTGTGSGSHQPTESLRQEGWRSHGRLSDVVSKTACDDRHQGLCQNGEDTAGGENPPLDIGGHFGLPDGIERALR